MVGAQSLACERSDGFRQRRFFGVPREADDIAALAIASTDPKLLFNVYAEAILATADRQGPTYSPAPARLRAP
jgi:hypothetical protein